MNSEIPESMVELVFDLQATVDYIKDRVTEQADSFDFEELVAASDALQAVFTTTCESLGIVKGEQIRQLESARTRVVGTRVFTRIPKRIERFDHDTIRRSVNTLAVEYSDDVDAAVKKATGMMGALYVVPSSKAKIGTLDALGIDRREVSSKETTGWDLRVEDLEPADDE